MNTTIKRNGKSHSECGHLGYLASIEAQQKLKQNRIDEYNLNPIRCKNCDSTIPYEKRHDSKFCNHSCSAVFNNKKRGFDSHKLEKEKFCIKCGTKIDSKRKYCSQECSSKKRSLTVFEKIENGEVEGHSSSTLRKYLIYKRGQRCEICGITEWKGKPLVVICDHIDGNSSNNNLDNLRLTCSNCDANLPTYKSKNKGSGRHNRRQRYKDGKSF